MTHLDVFTMKSMNDQEFPSTEKFSQKKKISRAALKSRRQEIEQCLAKFGLMRRWGHFFRRTHGAGPLEGLPSEETHSHRLCKALQSLGPVFSSFGIYMSSRVDVLPVSDCLEFATIPDWAEATPISAVRELIAQEIGRPQEEVYPVFEEAPFESRLMFQSHRAALSNGKAVTVKVIHPELEEQLECDLELLPVLKSAFDFKEWADLPIDDAMIDFRRTLQRQINLTHEVKAFEELAQDAVEFEMLKAPIVNKDLCSPSVITIEKLPGLNLKEIIETFDKRQVESVSFEGTRLKAKDLACNLCVVWLRQALLGNRFPVELRPENIIVGLPNKQIAFTAGEFASLPKEAKKNLWNYLIAASTEEPNQACSWLIREMINDKRSFDEEELRHRFREAVPFRDGGWSRNEQSNSLAEHLFLHWKLARSRGLRPQRHLLCFYRGLFQIAANARRLARYTDPLLEGFQEVRTIVMFAQFQEMVELRQLGDNFDKYTAMMIELPKMLDDVLTLATESHLGKPPPNRDNRMRDQSHRVREDAPTKNALTVVIALLLVLVAVVLLSHHISASIGVGVWIDRISATVFVLLGALLLRVASRTR